MTQLLINKLKKSFGDNEIFKNISLSLNYGDRIAIVGANGCGKTTLLNIISGNETKDFGDIFIAEGTSIEILEQNCTFDASDYELIEQKYLSMLNINAYSENLSGGEVTKLNICKLLSLYPTLLLLDEPTNNLDIDGIKTLINLLSIYDGSLIIVSHDRYFLDATVNKIIEIEHGVSNEYIGNYSAYREIKQKNYEDSLFRYNESKKKQKKIEESIQEIKQWSQKAHRDSTKKDSSGLTMGLKEYKRVKAKKLDKRIKNSLNRIEKLKTETRPVEEKKVYFQIKSAGTHGKRIVQATDLCKSYGEHEIIKPSNFTITRGEKVAIHGANGCGKTTLIKMIEQTQLPTSGELWVSPSSTPFILHQDFERLPKGLTILEYFISTIGNLTGFHRTVLNNLGIEAKHINQRIETLSFGEQMKIKLSIPILTQCDFIILDEPTNHIDIFTREMLEKTLKDYNGTLIIVSHDISLLDNISDSFLYFNDGNIEKSYR